MSGYILDTTFISDLGPRQTDISLNLLAWLEEHLPECFISAATLHEMEFGTARLERRSVQEARCRGDKLRRFHAMVRNLISDRIIPVDASIAVLAGKLRAVAEPLCGDIFACDAIIGATAAAFEHTVVTRNLRHFEAMGVQVADSRLLRGSVKPTSESTLKLVASST